MQRFQFGYYPDWTNLTFLLPCGGGSQIITDNGRGKEGLKVLTKTFYIKWTIKEDSTLV